MAYGAAIIIIRAELWRTVKNALICILRCVSGRTKIYPAAVFTNTSRRAQEKLFLDIFPVLCGREPDDSLELFGKIAAVPDTNLVRDALNGEVGGI